MIDLKRFFLSLTLFAILFSACQDEVFQTNDALSNIPEDVTGVTSINIQQLMDKADFDAVKEMDFYKDMIYETERRSPALAEVMKDPALSGIDLTKNLYVTYDVSPENPEEIFGATMFSINNLEDFETLLKNSDDVEFEDRGDYKVITSFEQQIVAWNDEIGIFGGSNSSYIDLEEKAKKIFETESDNSISQNKNLRKAFSGNHDVSGWMSSDPIASNPQAGLALTVLNISPDALKDNHIHSYMDFEDGALVGHSDFYLSDGLGKDFIGRFFKDEVKTDFSKYLPGENLVSVSTAAVDIRGIDQFLSERPQARGYVDFAVKEAGLEMKEIIAAFGGDVMVAGYADNNGNNDAYGLFSTNIKDEAAMETVLDLALENNVLVKLEDDYYKILTVGIPGGFTFSQGGGFGKMLVKDGLLFVSNNEDILNQIKDGGYQKSDRVNNEVKNLLKGNTVSSFFDFNFLQGFAKELENVQVKDMKFNVNGEGADFKLNLEEANKNSLKAIFEMINAGYQKSQGHENM